MCGKQLNKCFYTFVLCFIITTLKLLPINASVSVHLPPTPASLRSSSSSIDIDVLRNLTKADYDYQKIVEDVVGSLANTMEYFLNVTNKKEELGPGGLRREELDDIELDAEVGHDQGIVNVNPYGIILKGLGRLYEYYKFGQQLLILLGLIILPQIALHLSFPMVAVVFSAMYFPTLDPSLAGPWP